MKKFSIFLAAIAFTALFIAGCDKENEGMVNLSITDAPIDNPDIIGVHITVTDVQYHLNGETFESFPDFVGPKTYNLLDLTRGESELLGSLELASGNYTQIRFILDAPVRGTANPVNPGCYLEFAGGTIVPLFVPSGSESGFKGVGAFTVPTNGTVDITADFDARKSIVEAGSSGTYILKPTIRLIVNNEAGKIAGSVTSIPTNTQVVVFAYEDGEYTEAEAAEPVAESPRFPNAVVSDMVDTNGGYMLAFLAPLTYDLVIVAIVDGQFNAVLGVVENVVVESKKTTTKNIDISAF